MYSHSYARAALAAAMLSLAACGVEPHAADVLEDGLLLLPAQTGAVVPPTMLHLYDTSANGKPETLATSGIGYYVNLETSRAVGLVEDHGSAIMNVEGMRLTLQCSDGERVESGGPDRTTFRPSGSARVEARCTSGSALSAELVVARASDPESFGERPHVGDVGHDRYQHSGFPVALTSPDGSVTRLSQADERTFVASFSNGASSTVRTSFSLSGRCAEGEKKVSSGSITVASGASASISLQCVGALPTEPLFTTDGWVLN